MAYNQLEIKDEEFNNFMHKVTQVQNIVQKLASKDENEQAIGDLEAKIYLGDTKDPNGDSIDVDNVKLKIKENRTVINAKAFDEVSSDPSTMSQEAFKREVECDAKKRSETRKINLERMETLKKQAMLAYNRGDLERALSCYNKALDLIKDNHNMFLNRGLTYMKLGVYEKALIDFDRALYLNENSFKGHMLKIKLLFLMEEKGKMEKILGEAKEKFSGKIPQIEEYVAEFFTH